jgi:gas vesicle protein
MSESKSERSGSGVAVILGVLLGLAVGVIIALLLAPMKGDDLRHRILDEAERMRERYGDAVEQGKQAYDSAREEVLAEMK